MKKIKMQVITSCLSLVLVAGTLFTPVSVFAGTIGDPTTQLDGKLSTFHQGDANDCGAVSGIQALANSKFGKKLLSKVISVRVVLPIPAKRYVRQMEYSLRYLFKLFKIFESSTMYLRNFHFP